MGCNASKGSNASEGRKGSEAPKKPAAAEKVNKARPPSKRSSLKKERLDRVEKLEGKPTTQPSSPNDSDEVATAILNVFESKQFGGGSRPESLSTPLARSGSRFFTTAATAAPLDGSSVTPPMLTAAKAEPIFDAGPQTPSAGFLLVHTTLKSGEPVTERLSVLALNEAARRFFGAACRAAGAHLHAVLPSAEGSALFTLWELREGVEPEKAVSLVATFLGTAKVGRSIVLKIDEHKGAEGCPASFAESSEGAAPAGAAFYVVRMDYSAAADESDFFLHLASLHGDEESEARFDAACEFSGFRQKAFYPAVDQPVAYALWRAPDGANGADVSAFIATHVLPKSLGSCVAYRVSSGDFVRGLPEVALRRHGGAGGSLYRESYRTISVTL